MKDWLGNTRYYLLRNSRGRHWHDSVANPAKKARDCGIRQEVHGPRVEYPGGGIFQFYGISETVRPDLMAAASKGSLTISFSVNTNQRAWRKSLYGRRRCALLPAFQAK